MDTYAISFGTPDRFYEDHGVDGAGYLAWLAEMVQCEGSCVLALLGDEIAGQVESRILNVDRPGAPPRIGMVHLYYVRPNSRRRGIGAQLDEYMTTYYRAQGTSMLALCVSPTNKPAIAFYRSRGWIDEGPLARHPDVNRMTKLI